MTDKRYNSFYENTQFNLSVDNKNGTYIASAEVPDEVPLERLSSEKHSPQEAMNSLMRGLHWLFSCKDVCADYEKRGEKAAELINSAPGVVSTNFSAIANELTVVHNTLQSDMYSDVKWFAGLEETHWYINFDLDHGFVLSIEYNVQEFAPPLPENATWDDLHEKLKQKSESETLLNGEKFETLIGLYEEYDGETEVVHNTDVSDYHRLAGTHHSAEHVHYLINVRNRDVEEVQEELYSSLTVEEIEYLAQWAKENIPEKANEYALNNWNRFYPTKQRVEDIPEWLPREERKNKDNEDKFKSLFSNNE